MFYNIGPRTCLGFLGLCGKDITDWVTQKLTGEILKVVYATFSALSLAVFVMTDIDRPTHI
jgi:hypothetical protein